MTGGQSAPVAALVGPTASGKSELALAVALASIEGPAPAAPPVELVSVDSMAVYRGMDIGTAKPTPHQRDQVRYHLLDLVGPDQEFTVQQFQAAAERALADIAARGSRALLVGGTGLYLRSVTDGLVFPGRFPEVAAALESELERSGPDESAGRQARLVEMHGRLAALDPAAASRIAPSNRRRLVRALEVTLGSGRPFSSYGPGLERYPPTGVALFGIHPGPAELDRRIADRVVGLMAKGFLSEVRALASRPGGLSRTARQALGYRELLSHLERGVPLADAVDEAVRRTRALARRQWSWFRRDPRIVWFGPGEDPVTAILARLRVVAPTP